MIATALSYPEMFCIRVGSHRKKGRFGQLGASPLSGSATLLEFPFAVSIIGQSHRRVTVTWSPPSSPE